MADLVTRMRLDSAEYDQKVKRAAQNLLDFEAQCRATGESMNTLSKDNLEYVRNLGQMQTVSKNARGRISELSSAFTELSMQYKRLSDEEKNGEIGKALTASIDQLKGRITTLKTDLGDVNKEMGDTATSSQGANSAIDALTDKFGLSIKQLAGWGAAIGAAKAALDVAKDAFFSNEQTLDEWGRTVESAKSVYRGFLDALNTGDISGFLANIDNIVKAARDAYDAIDELGTFNAFNQRNVAKAQRGLSESMVDYREGKATKDQVRAAGEAYKNELRNRMKLENEAYIEAVNNLAQQRGVKSEDLMKAMSGTYGDYKKLKETPLTGTKTSLQFLGPGQAQSVTTAIPANEMERLGEALRRLNDTELQSLQALGAQADRTGNDIAQVDRQMARLLNGRGVSDGGGGRGGNAAETLTEGGIQLGKGMEGLTDVTIQTYESMASLRQKLAEYQRALDNATNVADEMAARQGIADTKWQMSDEGRAAAKIGWDRSDLEAVNKEMQDAIGELEPLKIKASVDIDSNAIKRTAKDASNVTTAFKAAAISADALAVALRNFDDPTMRIVSIIAEAIANVANGAGAAIAKAGQESASWIDYLAASTSVTAQMITTIAEIRSATKYAQGGMIEGNSYSGDNILAQGPSGLIGLNAGEVVLTKAMQGNLASQLSESGGGGGGVAMRPYVDSERIYLGMENMLTRRGKGEIVTTSMLRKMHLI